MVWRTSMGVHLFKGKWCTTNHYVLLSYWNTSAGMWSKGFSCSLKPNSFLFSTLSRSVHWAHISVICCKALLLVLITHTTSGLIVLSIWIIQTANCKFQKLVYKCFTYHTKPAEHYSSTTHQMITELWGHWVVTDNAQQWSNYHHLFLVQRVICNYSLRFK